MKFRKGDQLSLGTPESLTTERIAAFAVAGGDASPTHLSDLDARAAGYPAALAHGILGMAYCGRLIEREFPKHQMLMLQARFLAMTFHGDHLTCTGTVEEIDEGAEIIRLSLQVTNQHGIVVLSGAATVGKSFDGVPKDSIHGYLE